MSLKKIEALVLNTRAGRNINSVLSLSTTL